MGDAALIETKGAFARRCNVSPGRVSQWIASGQIGPDSLVGEGRSAQIRVDKALGQLKKRLDVGQRFGNGLTTRLDAPAPDAASELPIPAAAPPAGATPIVLKPAVDDTDEKIRQEKLREISMRNRRAAEEEAQRIGRLVLAADSRKALVETANQMLTIFEGALDGLATAIAARFEIPARDVVHLLRTEFRKVRSRAAEAQRRQRDGMPETVENSLSEQRDERDAA